MEYTQQQIVGNISQLILEKVNATVKPLEENLLYYLTNPEKNEDIIKSTIKVIEEVRENTFEMYGVKPQGFGKV